MGMKTIIKGKLYNTDTAELIYDSGFKQIFKSPKGIFFTCKITIGGVRAEVLTVSKVKEIIGIQAPDKYIEIFGKVEEG